MNRILAFFPFVFFIVVMCVVGILSLLLIPVDFITRRPMLVVDRILYWIQKKAEYFGDIMEGYRE